MKTYLLFFAFLFSFIPLHVFPQSDAEDTVYMKDGNIFTGKVSEQVHGISYRIERAGGSILTIENCDIKKIKKQEGPSGLKYFRPRCKIVFPYKNTGFFFQAQIPFGADIVGIKAITGYKFDRFAQIGIGFGFEYAASIYQNESVLGAGYAPIYFYYAGDILKKQFTPFYTVELGYAYAASIQNHLASDDQYDAFYQHGSGGLTGGIGLGYKYYSWNGRFTCSLSVNADFIHASLHEWGTYNPFWSSTSSPNFNTTYTGTLDMIGLKLSIGY